MRKESVAIPVRATALAQAGTGEECIVLHRADQLFDLLRFNQQHAFASRAVPASHGSGQPWEAVLEAGEVLVDRSVLGAARLRVFSPDDPDFEVSATDLPPHRTIDCCVLPDDPGADSDERSLIDNAITSFTHRRLLARLDETLEIPPLPAAAERILALRSDPDYPLKELVKVVETDPSIASRVMAWACSAFYAANPAPKSLSDAIMRVLGCDVVMNLALGLALAGTLRLPANQVRGLPPFWTEAVYTAAAMEALARRGDAGVRSNAGMSYLTGLLSNYGTLVAGHVFPPQYANICLLQEANPQLPARSIDQHVLTLPREALAAALFESWELPEATIAAIRFQHTRDYSGDCETEVRLLQTARALLGYGFDPGPLLEAERLDEIGINESDIQEVGNLLVDSRDALDGLVRAVA